MPGTNFQELNKDVLEFIDKTISCSIPTDPSNDMTPEEFEHYTEMKELLNRVRHSCTEDCFNKRAAAAAADDDDLEERCQYGFPRPVAAETWIEVTQQLDDDGKLVREKYAIHLKRNKYETNINNYNPFFLKV